MNFTTFLLLENDKSIANEILKKAEDTVADEAADSDGNYHDEKVLRVAKKLAKGNKNETAIIELIKIKLGLSRK